MENEKIIMRYMIIGLKARIYAMLCCGYDTTETIKFDNGSCMTIEAKANRSCALFMLKDGKVTKEKALVENDLELYRQVERILKKCFA